MKDIVTYSPIIAGTMTWGKWGKQLSKSAMEHNIKHCTKLGITTFDHADIYGDYTTEAQFGDAFSVSNIHREKVQFISKCGIQLIHKERGTFVKHYNYTKNYIVGQAEQSLKNLKTDYLDVLLLHRPSPLLQPLEVAEAITSLKKAGKIKAFGVSNFSPSQIAAVEKCIRIDVNQVEFSLTENNAIFNGIFDDCITNNRKAMAWSPLGGFFNKDDKQGKRIKTTIAKLTEKYNASADQLLLAWILKHPAKIAPVFGTTEPTRITKAFEATTINLELQDWFMLLEASNGEAP